MDHIAEVSSAESTPMPEETAFDINNWLMQEVLRRNDITPDDKKTIVNVLQQAPSPPREQRRPGFTLEPYFSLPLGKALASVELTALERSRILDYHMRMASVAEHSHESQQGEEMNACAGGASGRAVSSPFDQSDSIGEHTASKFSDEDEVFDCSDSEMSSTIEGGNDRNEATSRTLNISSIERDSVGTEYSLDNFDEGSERATEEPTPLRELLAENFEIVYLRVADLEHQLADEKELSRSLRIKLAKLEQEKESYKLSLENIQKIARGHNDN